MKFDDLSTKWKTFSIIGIISLFIITILVILILLLVYTDLIPLQINANIDDLQQIDLNKYDHLFDDTQNPEPEPEPIKKKKKKKEKEKVIG